MKVSVLFLIMMAGITSAFAGQNLIDLPLGTEVHISNPDINSSDSQHFQNGKIVRFSSDLDRSQPYCSLYYIQDSASPYIFVITHKESDVELNHVYLSMQVGGFFEHLVCKAPLQGDLTTATLDLAFGEDNILIK